MDRKVVPAIVEVGRKQEHAPFPRRAIDEGSFTGRKARDSLAGVGAYHRGALLSEDACKALLRQHAGEDAVFDAQLLVRATKPQILARMLVNLKRVYVHMHSFPQARDVTELLLAVDPSATNELRDRGLLAYHLNDFSSALRDLQAYLDLSPAKPADDEERKDYARIVEHVKTLRRRVATFN